MSKHKPLPDGDYVVVSDLQVPFENRGALKALNRFIRDFEPSGILNVGDEIDSPEPSHWNKGMAGEYIGTLWENFRKAHDVMAELDDSLRDGRKGADSLPHHIMRSNHGDRLEKYIDRYAPAMSHPTFLAVPRLLGYQRQCILEDRFGVELPITYHNGPFEFAPGWALMHGDELRGQPIAMCKQIGMSIVMGHTHKASISNFSTTLNNRVTSTLTGVEVGHLMDLTQVQYADCGLNWQSGFGLLSIRNRKVNPSLVLIHGRSFSVGGTTYSW